jgi:glycosyltransferase involved in cell wall biosynthesis
MRILCIVSDTVRDATAGQRHSLLAGLATLGHQVREFIPPLHHLSLWQQIRRWQPEVIHVWHPPSVLLGLLLKWCGQGSRLVVTVTTPPKDKRHWLSPKANRWLVPTEQLGFAWQQWGVTPERIKMIAPSISPALPGGTGEVFTRPELLKACDLPSKARLILCVGPLQAGSGRASAVWAADILHYLHQDVFLLIAGTGPEQDKLRHFAKSIQTERFVRFLGNRFLASELMNHADIVWEPTQQDEVTDSLILAQQFGKPILSVGQPCLQSLVHPQAVEWLPPHDPTLWAKRTHHLLTDAERQQEMGRAGQRFAQAHFCAETFVARHLKQYERLLATPAPTWFAKAA